MTSLKVNTSGEPALTDVLISLGKTTGVRLVVSHGSMLVKLKVVESVEATLA